MKKQILFMFLIVAILLMAQSTIAQTGKPGFSVFAAVNKSSIVGETESWKDPVGAMGGVIIDFAGIFSESLSFRSELNISLQGAKWDLAPGSSITGRTNLLYLNAPLVARYQSENGIFCEAGIQPGFLLTAKDWYEGVAEDYKEHIKKFDLSIPIGAGYEFKNKMGIGLRVITGLTNINTEGIARDYNFVVALRGIYTFKKKSS